MANAWKLPTDPTLRGVAAEAREEWRGEQDAAISDALELRAHTQCFTDVLRESMARGDRMTVRCHHVRAAGTICEVDDDLISIRNIGAGRVDLHRRDDLPIVVQVSEPASGPASLTTTPSGGFRGRMLTLEHAGDEVSVWLLGESESTDGRIEVGADCLWITSRLGARITVQLSSVIAVMPRA